MCDINWIRVGKKVRIYNTQWLPAMGESILWMEWMSQGTDELIALARVNRIETTELEDFSVAPFAIKGVHVALFDLNGQVLLVNERRKGFGFPGGKPEAGESAEDCLMREFREETGLELDSIKPLYSEALVTDYFKEVRSYLRVMVVEKLPTCSTPEDIAARSFKLFTKGGYFRSRNLVGKYAPGFLRHLLSIAWPFRHTREWTALPWERVFNLEVRNLEKSLENGSWHRHYFNGGTFVDPNDLNRLFDSLGAVVSSEEDGSDERSADETKPCLDHVAMSSQPAHVMVESGSQEPEERDATSTPR
jgi:8-oxo-dGTP pyrophosphatase MutT (NUDIX family)